MNNITHSVSLRFVSNADGAAILDTECGQIFTLNETGAFIWQGLQSQEDVETLTEKLASTTGREPVEVRSDILRFVDSLVRNNVAP